MKVTEQAIQSTLRFVQILFTKDSSESKVLYILMVKMEDTLPTHKLSILLV